MRRPNPRSGLSVLPVAMGLVVSDLASKISLFARWLQTPLHHPSCPVTSLLSWTYPLGAEPQETREPSGRRQHCHIFVHMFSKSNMRFHHQLDDLLGSRIRLRLLRILVRSGARGLTGRELARLCDASSSQTISSLQQLEDSGVIAREIAGRAHVWRIAEGHALAPVLASLFRAEAESFTALKTDIEDVIRKLPVRRAFLFGSVARGDERATSDVDLMVVVQSRADKERVEEALSAASLDFASKFGNPLSSLVMDEKQLRTPPNPSLISNIRQDGVELEVGA